MGFVRSILLYVFAHIFRVNVKVEGRSFGPSFKPDEDAVHGTAKPVQEQLKQESL